MEVNSFSYWEQTSFTSFADVIIIGSGIVGLSAAMQLKKGNSSLRVLVLERGFLPSGASTKNAGFACFGTVSELTAALKNSTEEEVLKLVDYKWRGLQRLRVNLGDAEIDYQQHGGYELFTTEGTTHADTCIAQIEKLNKLLAEAIGYKEVYSMTNHKIADFGFDKVSKMIFNPLEGQIDTGKMMRALLNRVNRMGILVLNTCTIKKIEHAGKHINLLTRQGVFKATKVILATNAFAAKIFPELKVTPGRGQVLVTKPIAGLKIEGTFHFDEGYYYFRNINNRVLFGGGRNLNLDTEGTWEFGHTNLVKETLTAYLRNMILPGQDFEIDYWWSGIMGFGESRPIIQEVEPNVFCAVRCNGMGIAMGSLVGEDVAELAYPHK